jgi:cyanophycinase
MPETVWHGHTLRNLNNMIEKSFFRGCLIAIGGNEDRENDLVVLKRVVQEIQKTDYKVGVITTASETPEQRGEDYRQVFKTLGASEIEILNIKDRAQANNATMAKTLEDADLIFLVGGDQLRLTTIIGGSLIFEAIRNRLEMGAIIAGTSAGAAVFSDTMIYDGKSEEGLIKGSVLTTSGFGFVENVVFDTHFNVRGRVGRLAQIITMNPACIGVGIGEDSGVLLKGDGLLEVIGLGTVVIIDGSDIAHSNVMNIEPGEPIAVENVRIHSLVNGYGYHFKERKFLTPSQIEEYR